MTLRSRIIRLAHQNPNGIRGKLLPLLVKWGKTSVMTDKTAAPLYTAPAALGLWVRGHAESLKKLRDNLEGEIERVVERLHVANQPPDPPAPSRSRKVKVVAPAAPHEVVPVTTERVWGELVKSPPMDRILDGLDRGDFIDWFNDYLTESLNRMGGLSYYTEITHGYGEIEGSVLKWRGQWVENVLEEGEIPVDTNESVIRKNFQNLGAKVTRCDWGIEKLKGWRGDYEPFSVYEVSMSWDLDFQLFLNNVFKKSAAPGVINEMVTRAIANLE